MQRIQRKFGSFLPRTVNEQQVGALLNDFEDADQMLGRIINATEEWKNAWSRILIHQLQTTNEFELLYQPIIASGQESNRIPADTPEDQLERTVKLREAYVELKTELAGDIASIESRLIRPAKDARMSLKSLRKPLKKRDDLKLDYERYKNRVESLQNKPRRSERENGALTKHENDLARATDEYHDADHRMREVLPPLLNAVFQLLPGLLATQIEIQNALLGQVYTTLFNYASEWGFPNPPPELDEIEEPWDAAYTPLKNELESSSQLLAHGKAIHQPMRLPEQSLVGGMTDRMPNMGAIQNKFQRRKSSQNPGSPGNGQRRLSAPHDGAASPPPTGDSSKQLRIGGLTSRPKTSGYSPSAESTKSGDYFGQGQSRMPAGAVSSFTGASEGALSSPGIGKKKPPPPPPKKIGSFQGEFVTAMYDFDPINEGDLGFREGDRIKVVKKTQSSQDWWEGELNGQRGSFPANYAK